MAKLVATIAMSIAIVILMNQMLNMTASSKEAKISMISNAMMAARAEAPKSISESKTESIDIQEVLPERLSLPFVLNTVKGYADSGVYYIYTEKNIPRLSRKLAEKLDGSLGAGNVKSISGKKYLVPSEASCPDPTVTSDCRYEISNSIPSNATLIKIGSM